MKDIKKRMTDIISKITQRGSMTTSQIMAQDFKATLSGLKHIDTSGSMADRNASGISTSGGLSSTEIAGARTGRSGAMAETRFDVETMTTIFIDSLIKTKPTIKHLGKPKVKDDSETISYF